MSNCSSPPSMKWNQHPVIATVLWILGTETTSTGNNETERNSYSSQGKLNVIWKDEQGGSINEYFSQVQTPLGGQNPTSTSLSSSASNNRNSTGTQLLPTAFQSQESTGGGSPMRRATAASTSLSQHNQPDSSSIPVDITTPSPQWGFYVPITPPQQESYARQTETAQ
jgi:hypothetical protein